MSPIVSETSSAFTSLNTSSSELKKAADKITLMSPEVFAGKKPSPILKVM